MEDGNKFSCLDEKSCYKRKQELIKRKRELIKQKKKMRRIINRNKTESYYIYLKYYSYCCGYSSDDGGMIASNVTLYLSKPTLYEDEYYEKIEFSKLIKKEYKFKITSSSYYCRNSLTSELCINVHCIDTNETREVNLMKFDISSCEEESQLHTGSDTDSELDSSDKEGFFNTI